MMRTTTRPGAVGGLTLDDVLLAVAPGDRFEIEAGSRVGMARLRGVATVEHRDAGSASITVECRSFGLRARGGIEVSLGPDGTIALDVRGLPFVSAGLRGTPVVAEPDHLLLAVQPSGTFEVEHDADADTICVQGTGLRVGTVTLALRATD